jgi:hypothetical protein
MLRRLCAILLSVVLPLTTIHPVSAQACNECTPRPLGSYAVQGVTYVCNSGIPNTSFDFAKDGGSYWNPGLWQHQFGATFVFRAATDSCEAGDLKIRRSTTTQFPDRAEWNVGDKAIDVPIGFDNWAGADHWRFMSAHELGHALSIADAYPGSPNALPSSCQNSTIMGDSWQWGTLKCGDAKYLSNANAQANSSSSGETSPAPPGDCYNSYLVTTYYCWTDSSGWFYCGSEWQYLGSWCY